MKGILKYLLLGLTVLLYCINSFGQQYTYTDSLKLAIKSASQDTLRARLNMTLVEVIAESSIDSVIPLCERTIALCERGMKNNPNTAVKTAFLKSLAAAYNNMGFVHNYKGNITKAISCFEKSKTINEKVGDKYGLTSILNNIGYIYDNQGDIPKALENYHASLKLQEELGDKEGTALSLNNIGYVYLNQGNFQKGLDCYLKSQKIYEQIGNKQGIALTLNNIGTAYEENDEHKKALEYFIKSLLLREEIDDKQSIAISLHNIGLVYEHENNLPKALEYYHKALVIREQTGEKEGISASLNRLGSIYFKNGNLSKANEYAMQSLKMSKEIGYPEKIRNSAKLLFLIAKSQKKFENALIYHELYISMVDSIKNEENKRASIQKDFQYQFDKKEIEVNARAEADKDKTKAIAKEEKKKQQLIIYGVGIGLIMVIIFSGFLFNRFKITQKQKKLIEIKESETQLQKHIIEEKHKEITDSIQYAERIQRSFLATKKLLDDNLKDYFVFFQPKDVVSGDFYWAANGSESSVTNSNRDLFYLVTADSTGHGVPGAIMSILNISCLENAVKGGLTQPSEIFNHTRLNIIERLKKDGSEEGGKDGMDASIICFDFKNNTLTYSAANNPVWIVRENKILEFPFDKMPVGKHDRDSNPFTQHSINLQKGDIVYSLTDGLPDQFGGPKGKKFMYKKLKELLICISSDSTDIQKQKLATALNDWKGNLEQVDDITLIGVRI